MGRDPKSAIFSSPDFTRDIENRVDELIKNHQLKSKYIAGREFASSYEKDNRRHWFSKNEWNEKLEKEKKRATKAEQNFDLVRQRLVDLYKNKYQELGNFENITQSGLDGKIVEAFEERQAACLRASRQRELMSQVDKQLEGKGPSMSERMIANRELLNNRLGLQGDMSKVALGGDASLRADNDRPRSFEKEWMKKNLHRFNRDEKICDKNLDSILKDGTGLDYAIETEEELIRKNSSRTAIMQNAFGGAGRSAINFINKVFNGGKGRYSDDDRGGRTYSAGDIDRQDLTDWSSYRDLKKKERELANSYAGRLGFINNKSLDWLKSVKESLDQQRNTELDPQYRYYLEQYLKQIEDSIKNLETALKNAKEGEKGFDTQMKGLTDRTDQQMQDALDDKNERLKWNILCLFLMSSPFLQGAMVVGPLFDYLNFLGDILGPVFMHEDGFAVGFAKALENFPIFGELIKLTRFSDGVEIVFKETPFLKAFTGEEGVIDGFTRNTIFRELVNTFNFQYLTLGAMAGAGTYLVVKNTNDTFGENTSNTKTSVKVLKEKHMEAVNKICEEALAQSKVIDDNQEKELNRKMTTMNRNYFQKISVAHILEDKIANVKLNANMDDLVKLFEGSNIFGEAGTSGEKIEKIQQYLESDDFLSEKDTDFTKKATIIANEMVNNPDISYNEMQKAISVGEIENNLKSANNAFSIRYFDKEIESMDIPPIGLWDIAKTNENGDLAKAAAMIEEMDRTISDEKTRRDRAEGLSFAPMKSPIRPTGINLNDISLDIGKEGARAA